VNRLPFTLAAALLFVASVFGGTVRAEERILEYRSDIRVQVDGRLQVAETIRVRSEGRQIRRGIYRDFPVRYRDRYGNAVKVGFRPQSVRRDGAAEPWRVENRGNDVRLYVGHADKVLPPGVHEYEIVFETDRQIGFFENHDELYFNAVGTGSVFPIDRAEVRVTLPFELERERVEAFSYLGAYGSNRDAGARQQFDGRTLRVSSDSGLVAGEGLTFSLTWPKGLIPEPSPLQKAHWFFADNGGALVLLLTLAGVLAWYAWAWNEVGRDPDGGVIIPRYAPPKGLSPAACQYVRSMAFGRDAFTAALISLAVKGQLNIEETGKNEFTLERRPPPAAATPPSAGEQAVLDALLPTPGTRIAMDNENHEAFQAARSALRKALKQEYHGKLFKLNGAWLLPAFLATVAGAVFAMFLHAGPLVWIAYAVLGIAIHVTFVFLMRAPTRTGRQVMDAIEGFRMYLGTAERERLDRMRSPEMTPEVFESFLPYAFALGVENDWCDRFAREMPREAREAGYQPAWYSGQLHGLGAVHHLGSGFSGAFGGAIASASSPPGSSSGAGGGGFSGGGGGGGGVGGW